MAVKRKRLAGSLLAIAFWLLVWFFLSRGKAGLFLAGPDAVLRRLLELLGEADSWRRLLHSLLRVLCGFLAAFLLAPPLALLSRSSLFRSFLSLPLQLMKAVPLAALIILMIFWLPSARLSPVIALMPALPLLYETLAAALSQLDPQLEEMADVYGISRRRRLWKIELPQLLPSYRAAAGTALGFAFKAGIAAEVIGLPEASIGEALYDAKICLDSASLLAWVFLILGLSALVSRVFHFILARLLPAPLRSSTEKATAEAFSAKLATGSQPLDEGAARLPALESEDLAFLKRVLRPSCQGQLKAEDLGLHFSGPWLFRHLSLNLSVGGQHRLTAPSGSGKTSLLRVLGGRETPTEGRVLRDPQQPLAWLFQEDRLLESASGLDNLRLLLPSGNPDKEKAARLLLKLLGLESAAERPAATYSAGMKRRLALARTLLVDSPFLFLDEPLAHLDDENAARIRLLCETLAEDRVLVLASHRDDGASD